jgi:hypothetical protein
LEVGREVKVKAEGRKFEAGGLRLNLNLGLSA